jgi:hypothetical protein
MWIEVNAGFSAWSETTLMLLNGTGAKNFKENRPKPLYVVPLSTGYGLAYKRRKPINLLHERAPTVQTGLEWADAHTEGAPASHPT